MSSRARRVLALVAWVAALVATIVAVGAAGRGPLAPPPVTDIDAARAWVEERDAAEIVFALVRLVVLALAWYLLATTVVGTGLRLAGATRLVSVADALSVPGVRCLVQAALGVSLATASLGGAGGLVLAGPGARPAGAEGAAPEMVRLAEEDPDQVVMHRLPAGDPPDPPVMTVVPGEWVLEPGQHLWSVAATVLARSWGRSPTDDEITPYWAHLIDANRDRLADRDNPDLVFPSQVLVVPTPPPPP